MSVHVQQQFKSNTVSVRYVSVIFVQVAYKSALWLCHVKLCLSTALCLDPKSFFFCLDDKQVLFECKLPFHTGHQIRHLAYRFRPLFSLAVASPFYSQRHTYALYLEVSVSATALPLSALLPYVKCIPLQIYGIIFMSFRKIAESDCQLHLICPSFCMEQLGSHWTDFHEILYLSFLENLPRKFKFC